MLKKSPLLCLQNIKVKHVMTMSSQKGEIKVELKNKENNLYFILLHTTQMTIKLCMVKVYH